MEKKNFSEEIVDKGILTGLHISKAVDNSIKYLDDRRQGINTGLKTRWTRLNSAIGGGIEWSSNYAIAGISGSGKSSIANMLETDLFDFNPEEKFIVLNFNFEMPSHMQIVRKFSTLDLKTVHELQSVTKPLQSNELNKLREIGDKLKNYNIFYFDVSGNVSQIVKTILHYHETFKGYKILNIFDHTRLISKYRESNEYDVVTNMVNEGIKLKKSIGCTNIFISQLNRDIEDEKRLTNPNLHYPLRSDIFGSDALYQGCDYVFVIHRPKQLGLEYYGPKNIPTNDLVAFHVLKNRNGEAGMVRMRDRLEYNIIEEVAKD